MDVGRPIMRNCGHTYVMRFLTRGSIVVDLGAHKGEFAINFIRDFACRVFGAEPVPELYAELPRHENFEALPVALGEQNGRVNIAVFADQCASIYGSEANNASTILSVECVTLEEFLSRFHLSYVDLLKVDIEGAEIGLFRGANDDTIKKIKQITIEFHDFLFPEMRSEVEEVIKKIENLGFWRINFSLDNTDVLFLNRALLDLWPFEYAFLKYFVKYIKGFERVARRAWSRKVITL